MAQSINVGFNNYINTRLIMVIAAYDSRKYKEKLDKAKGDGMLVDLKNGKKARSIIITYTNHYILSAIGAETLSKRLDGNDFLDIQTDVEDVKDLKVQNDLNERKKREKDKDEKEKKKVKNSSDRAGDVNLNDEEIDN